MSGSKHSLITAIAVLFISFALLLGWLVWERTSQAEQERQQAFEDGIHLHLQHIESAIKIELRHANSLADTLARNEGLLELLKFGDALELQQWTVQKQEDLSAIVGLAVFDQFAKVIGSQKVQRIGPRCVADMQSRLSGRPTPVIPVHQEMRRWAHYDLVRDISVGDNLYHLLVSFHLSRLRDTLASLAREDTYYELTQNNGELLFRLGVNQGDEQIDWSIGDTGWHLLVRVSRPQASQGSVGWWVDIEWPIMLAIGLFLLLVWVVFSRIRADTLGLKRAIVNLGLAPDQQEDVPQLYFAESAQVAQMLQTQAQQITELQEELAQEARIDVLTGLRNRRALEESVDRWLAYAQREHRVSLTVLDLDGFKQVNDLCGHATGDILLQSLGRLLRASVRDSDEAVRLGGDEFVVIHADMPCQLQSEWFSRLREQFLVIVQQQVKNELVAARVDISAGTRVLMKGKRDFFAVLGSADGLLYKAKEQGGGCIVFDDCDL